MNYCKWKGYDERVEDQASMLRIASFRIHQSLVQKPMKLSEYWPLPSDKKVSYVQKFMTPEMLEKIRSGIKKIKDV